MNPRILTVYQETFHKQLEEQLELVNWTAWIQGQYHVASIAAALGGRKNKYPKKPFKIFDNEAQMSGEESFLLWIDEYNRKFEKKEKQNKTERP